VKREGKDENNQLASSSSSSFSFSSSSLPLSSCSLNFISFSSSHLISSSSSSFSSLSIQHSNITNLVEESSSSPPLFHFSSPSSLSLILSSISLSCSCLSSTEGGGMKYASSSSGGVKFEGSTFHDCSCSSSDGRGGGIYLDISKQDLTKFELSSLSFYLNSAKVGEDMFIIVSSFLSLFPSSDSSCFFSFAVKNGVWRRFSLFGKEKEDEDVFFPIERDLYVFIMGYHSSPFFLSYSSSDDDDDHNFSYCGISLFPCSSLSYLLEKDFSLDEHKVNGMSEIVLINEISVFSSVSLMNVMIKPEEGNNGKIEIEEGFVDNGKGCVIEIKQIVSIQHISFPFSSPSSVFIITFRRETEQDKEILLIKTISLIPFTFFSSEEKSPLFSNK
jgi:hypothetical protein